MGFYRAVPFPAFTMDAVGRLKRLPKELWKLGWISFFADVSSEMVYPIIPLFLKETLRAPVIGLGIVEGVAESVVSFMKGWSGFRSDQTGRRLPFVQTGYTLSAMGKPLLAASFAWPMVLVGRAVDRIGKGLRGTARDALLADVVPSDLRGTAFGIHRAMDTAGALVGVLLAALLVMLLPGQYRVLFLMAAVPGLIAAYLTFRLKEPRRAEPPPRGSARAALREMPRGYWAALALTLVFGAANSSDTFLLLRASSLGLSDGQVIGLYALYNVTYLLISYPAGALSDRIGRWWVIGVGWVLYALVYAGFATQGSGLLLPLFALYGVYIGLTRGAGVALVADQSPPDRKGAAMGFFFMASGFMTLLASALTGWLWFRFSAATAFAFCAWTAAVAVVLIPVVRWMARPPIAA